MIRFKVNGADRTYDGDPEMPLLWYLRDVAGFTGTKFGCGMSMCGACTVHQNGEAVRRGGSASLVELKKARGLLSSCLYLGEGSAAL